VDVGGHAGERGGSNFIKNENPPSGEHSLEVSVSHGVQASVDVLSWKTSFCEETESEEKLSSRTQIIAI